MTRMIQVQTAAPQLLFFDKPALLYRQEYSIPSQVRQQNSAESRLLDNHLSLFA